MPPANQVNIPGTSQPGVLLPTTAPTPSAELLRSIAVAKRFGVKTAHDFNNIMAVIHGFAGILQSRLRHDEANRDIAQQIESSALEALDLTAWLAAFGNNQSRDLVLLDFNTVVEESLTILWDEKPANIDLEIYFASEALIVLGDEAQLAQICRELWRTAIEAMPHGGRLRWETSLEVWGDDTGTGSATEWRTDALVRLRVEDSGLGMDQETLHWIFEPFFSTKNGKDRGLGLSMVYDTVNAHRGFVEVYSQPGAGACLEIYFPAQLAQTPAPEETPSLNPAREQHRPKVLVVDDETIVLTLVQQLLRPHNYEVVVAESGEVALDLYGQSPEEISAVLLDMTLPGLSGLETFQRLKELDGQVKVIVFTGDPHQQAVHDAVSLGALGVLAKPFHPQHLAEVVHEALS